MQEAHISDFSSLNSRAILRRSNAFYALRVGGFIVTTGGGTGCIVWGIAGGRMSVAFAAMCLFVFAGLVMFVLSIHARSDCASCGSRLDVYFCSEERTSGRYSGHIYVCRQCNAYEGRLNLESD